MVPLGIDFGSRILRLAITATDNSQPASPSRYLGALLIQEAIGPQYALLGDSSLKTLLDEGNVPYTRSKPIPLVELTAEMLKRTLHTVEHKLQTTISDCTITVPCGYGARGRQQLQDAARMAGFERARLLLEPMAVLLAHKSESTEKLVLVCSWGENRCNILLARVKGSRIEEIVQRGEMSISGTKLMETVRRHLRQIHRQRTGQDPELSREIVNMQNIIARQVLETLSEKDEVEIPYFARKEIGLGSYRINRSQLLSWIEEDLHGGLEACQQALHKAGIANPQILDEVWLAGGVTQIPKLRELFMEWWGKEPHFAEAESVALGAAMFASTLRNAPDNDKPNQVEATEKPPEMRSPESPPSEPSAIQSLQPQSVTSQPESPQDNERPQVSLSKDELRLVKLLRQVDHDLEQGNIEEAVQAVQNALEVVNAYRARIIFTQGMQFLENARNMWADKRKQTSSNQRKSLAKKIDALFTLANEKVEEALRLNYGEDTYRETAEEIARLRRDLDVEELYLEALKNIEENHFQEAIKNFRLIFQRDPENTYCREPYAKTLLFILIQTKKDYDRRSLRQSNRDADKKDLRRQISKLKELYQPETAEMQLILQIEHDIDNNSRTMF